MKQRRYFIVFYTVCRRSTGEETQSASIETVRDMNNLMRHSAPYVNHNKFTTEMANLHKVKKEFVVVTGINEVNSSDWLDWRRHDH